MCKVQEFLAYKNPVVWYLHILYTIGILSVALRQDVSFFRLFFYLYMNVLPACMYMHYVLASRILRNCRFLSTVILLTTELSL